MATPEGTVKAKVKRILAKYGSNVYAFWPVQMGMGASTLDCLGTCCGKSFAVETKAPGQKLTKRQQLIASKIVSAGGRVFVISDDEGVDLLDQYLEETRAQYGRESASRT